MQSALTGEANGVRIETDAGIGSTCWTVVLHPRIAGDKPERPLARHRVRLTRARDAIDSILLTADSRHWANSGTEGRE